MKLMKLARRNIFRNKRRSLLSATAIAIATFTMVFLFAFIAGIKDDMGQQIQDYVTGEVRIQHKDYEKNQNIYPLSLSISDIEDTMKKLDSNPEVQASVARIPFPGVFFQDEEQKPLLGWAVDFQREQNYSKMEKLLIQGDFPSPGLRETLLGSTLSKDLGLKVGDDISILYRTARMSTNYITFKISGLIAFPMGALNRQIFLVDRNLMAGKLFMEDQASTILIKTAKGNPGALTKTLQPLFSQELDIRSWENISSLYSFMGMAEIIYDFMGIFFYILGSTVIISTTMMVVFERIREIGTISAMGMTQKEILKLFFLEAFQLSVAGALAGLVLGIITVLPL